MNISKNISFDRKVYTVETIQKAAYRLCDKFAVNISEENDAINCAIIFSTEIAPGAEEAIVNDLLKEVIDQHLREKIKAETADIRNLILSYTFSKTGLQSSE